MGKSNSLIVVVITLIIFAISLSACAVHMTKETGEELNPAVLNAAFNTQSTNLANYSKCASQPAVRIINAETNNNDLVIGLIDNMESRPYIIKPKELNDFIVEYFKDAYSKNMIKSDNNSTKKIEISIAKAKILRTLFGRGAAVTLKVSLPEIKKDYEFSSEQWTGWADPYRALAYAIHETVWKVINDKSIQDYILCK